MAQVNRSFEFGDPPGVGREWDRLVQNEGYDLSKFELVAVPEEFSDASGTDQIGHGGLLDYDGIIDVEGSDSDESCVDPAEGFNATIEHVGDEINQGSGLVHLLEVPSHQSETRPYHKDDILDVGIEACDLKSLLEQFEEIEQPPKDPRLVPRATQPEPAPVPQPVPPPEVLPAQKETTRYKIATPMKDLPNPADVVKKIAPVKRKGAILLEAEALPFKKVKPKPVSQNPEVNKAIHLARSTHAASPIPFNLKNLIPAPKYLSMEHDYCMSPTPSDKSVASDQPSQMSQEQRRAYYKYKYRVKKKMDGVDSPSKGSSVSSSPISMSPASLSPNPAAEVSDGKEPSADMPKPAAVVPLFDKIPGYFSKKLLVGMYREIDSEKPSKPVHQGYDKNIFVSSEKGDGDKSASKPVAERKSRQRARRIHRRSYRQSRRKNSLSSQSDSSYCSSCSEHSDRDNVENDTRGINRNSPVRRRRRTRDSICSARSRDSRSPSYSRSRSRSASYSSYSDRGSIRSTYSYSRSRSRSFSRSRSRSYSRSPSYSRSRSRSFSRSHSYSRSRSRSRSPSRNYRRRSRSYSRSISRSPERTRRSYSRHRLNNRQTRSRSRRRSGSRSRSRSRAYSRSRNNNRSSSRIRTYHPVDSKEVIYTREQLKEFEERRVVYVGNIERDTTKIDLEKQFSRFGPVDKIQLYFRDDKDNYGFVTFRYKCDAVAAITSGHDPNWPKYDLCFGGRRKFCQNKYEDLDSLNRASTELDFGYNGNGGENGCDSGEPQETEFDKLLKAAMKGSKKR